MVHALVTILLLTSVTAFGGGQDSVIKKLKDYCETNTRNPMLPQSVACKVSRGEENLGELCKSLTKRHIRNARKLRDVVSHYSMATGVDEEKAQSTVCSETVAKVTSDKPECQAELKGEKSVSRKWWNGQAWVSTTETIDSVRKSADKGDPYSQFNLGFWLTTGASCVEKDMAQGVPYLCKSYDQGFNMATQHFGSRLNRESMGKEYGCDLTERQKSYAQETKVYERKALAHLKKAKSGDVTAMTKVGSLYLSNDYGLKQDYQKAFYWFEKAAKKGHTPAIASLAGMYNRGDGVTANDTKAFEWTLKAAKRGDADSMFFVGDLYYNGQGTPVNHATAIKWYAKAMDRGHKEALDRLSEMYLKGELQAAAFKSVVRRLKSLEAKIERK